MAMAIRATTCPPPARRARPRCAAPPRASAPVGRAPARPAAARRRPRPAALARRAAPAVATPAAPGPRARARPRLGGRPRVASRSGPGRRRPPRWAAPFARRPRRPPSGAPAAWPGRSAGVSARTRLALAARQRPWMAVAATAARAMARRRRAVAATARLRRTARRGTRAPQQRAPQRAGALWASLRRMATCTRSPGPHVRVLQ